MKNIIQIDITTYIILLLSLISGNFKNILILYIIIFIHELGHILFLKIFNKEIISIKFYPFGGISKYKSLINHNIFQELLIALGGIIFQLILFILIIIFYKLSLINNYTYNLLINNNYYLLIFNLIPITGLDGEKIFHLLLEYIFSFHSANNISIFVSLVSLFLFTIHSFYLKINSLFVLTFLIYKIFYFINTKKYFENKFYLERYLYDIPYKKIKYLKNDNLKNMYQETYHFFNNKKEFEYLNKLYKNI